MQVAITIEHAETDRYASFTPLTLEYVGGHRVNLQIGSESIIVDISDLRRAVCLLDQDSRGSE